MTTLKEGTGPEVQPGQRLKVTYVGTLPDGTPCQVPGIVPKLSATPGGIDRPAPTLGQDTDAVLERLGVDADTRARWREQGHI